MDVAASKTGLQTTCRASSVLSRVVASPSGNFAQAKVTESSSLEHNLLNLPMVDGYQTCSPYEFQPRSDPVRDHAVIIGQRDGLVQHKKYSTMPHYHKGRSDNLSSYDGHVEPSRSGSYGEPNPRKFQYAPNSSQPTALTSFGSVASSSSSQVSTPSAIQQDYQDAASQISGKTGSASSHAMEIESSKETTGEASSGGSPFYKRHRRNLAALRISTTHVKTRTKSCEDQNEEVPILSPEPISPARQLRVKHSIPQLMKALPRLPDEPDEDGGTVHDEYRENTERGQLPRNHGGTSDSDRAHDDAVNMNFNGAGQPLLNIPQINRAVPQKFKLKVKKSYSQRDMNEHESPSITPSGDNEVLGPKKLKVKVSRKQRDGQSNAVLRGSALKQCNSLADLEHKSRTDLLLASKGHPEKALNRCASDCMINGRLPNSGVGEWNIDNAPRDPFDSSPKMPTLHQSVIKHEFKLSTDQVLPSGRTSDVDERTGLPGPRGLRQKISMLRLRSSEPRRAKLSKRRATPTQKTSVNRREGNRSHLYPAPSRTTTTSVGTGRAEGRLMRLARSAKRIVKRCVRRRLDHPSVPDA